MQKAVTSPCLAGFVTHGQTLMTMAEQKGRKEIWAKFLDFTRVWFALFPDIDA